MPIRLVYLAWVRDKIGIGEEALATLPDGICTPTDMVVWLAGRGDGYAAAFADVARLRCAVDQQMVAMDAQLAHPSEIAFFPPVTGG
jgi:sulfur-carrier protein